MDLGGPSLDGVQGMEDPSGVQEQSPGGSLGAKLHEAEETLQIVHVRKVFCLSCMVSKQAYTYVDTVVLQKSVYKM